MKEGWKMSITCYKGRLIRYEDGVINSKHNSGLHKAISEYLWKYGYEFGGGSVEKTRVNLSVQTPASTGIREMGALMKKIFGFSELVIDGFPVN